MDRYEATTYSARLLFNIFEGMVDCCLPNGITSRDTCETYKVIDLLRKLGVDLQAMEQSLNMKIPEINDGGFIFCSTRSEKR